MPVSSIAKPFYFIILILFSLPIYAENFSVDFARVTKIGNGYALDAQFSYPLTKRVEEAIENGVPIVYSQQLKLLKKTSIFSKKWIWEQTLWTSEIRYEIRYHALSQQYILINLGTQHQSSFPSLGDALQILGEIKALSLPPEHLAKRKGLSLQLRSDLDLYALPTPMRPGALISKKWQLASPWVFAQWD